MKELGIASIADALVKVGSDKAVKASLEIAKIIDHGDAKMKLVTALSKFRADCPDIEADKEVSFNNTAYKYAPLGESLQKIVPALSKHGLAFSWMPSSSDGVINVECVVLHVDGGSVSCALSAPADPSGKKNPVQAIKSTITYLQRITLFSLLGIAPVGDDDDAHAAGGSSGPAVATITPEQARDIRELHKKAGGDLKILLGHFGVDKVDDLPSFAYGKVIGKLQARLAAQMNEEG